jgi:hypothetical protein
MVPRWDGALGGSRVRKWRGRYALGV